MYSVFNKHNEDVVTDDVVYVSAAEGTVMIWFYYTTSSWKLQIQVYLHLTKTTIFPNMLLLQLPAHRRTVELDCRPRWDRPALCFIIINNHNNKLVCKNRIKIIFHSFSLWDNKVYLTIPYIT